MGVYNVLRELFKVYDIRQVTLPSAAERGNYQGGGRNKKLWKVNPCKNDAGTNFIGPEVYEIVWVPYEGGQLFRKSEC